jgi:hypothetical protein
MSKMLFLVRDTESREIISVVEMDKELAISSVDSDTLLLKVTGKLSRTYTIEPIENTDVIIASRLYKAYNSFMTEPVKLPSSMLHRMDELVKSVGLLFKPVEYTQIESLQDLQDLVTNTRMLPTVKHHPFGIDVSSLTEETA